jgi:flavin reductase (DIM6/NTAB) family NADH-FMN oxidoreductase RutF
MEARLHQYVPIANHEGQIITDLFIVEITDFYFDSAVFDEEHQYILPEKLQPIARLAGKALAVMAGPSFYVGRRTSRISPNVV